MSGGYYIPPYFYCYCSSSSSSSAMILSSSASSATHALALRARHAIPTGREMLRLTSIRPSVATTWRSANVIRRRSSIARQPRDHSHVSVKTHHVKCPPPVALHCLAYGFLMSLRYVCRVGLSSRPGTAGRRMG